MAADGAGGRSVDRLAKRQARADLSTVDARTAKQLLADHERTVRIEVAKVTRRRGLKRVVWMDREDLMQVGRSAVLEAWVKYNPERGAALATWITTVVGWRVREAAEMAIDPSGALYVVYAVKKASRRGKATKEAVDRAMDRYQTLLRTQVVSLAATTTNGFGRTFADLLVDPGASPEDEVVERQARDRIYRLIELLDRRHQMILVAELHGQSGASLAREIGVSRQRVNDQRKRALVALRAAETQAAERRAAEERQAVREALARRIADRAAARVAAARLTPRRRRERECRPALAL